MDVNEYGEPISKACENDDHVHCTWRLCGCYCHNSKDFEPKPKTKTEEKPNQK